jgi:hypothetical protein
MATILEALQNARHNLMPPVHPLQGGIGYRQLKNAVALLEKGYDLEDEIDELLADHGCAEDVPEKQPA